MEIQKARNYVKFRGLAALFCCQFYMCVEVQYNKRPSK